VVVGTAWDTRIARRIAVPLVGTWVRPNHVTTVGLGVGLAAAALYATGSPVAANVAAALYVVSSVIDHVDGALARLTGTGSAFGRAYDRAADLIVRIALFAGMGWGLRAGRLGTAAVALGLAAGVSFVGIWCLRTAIARRNGWHAVGEPRVGGIDLEDVLYVIAPVTWLGWLAPFVVGAGVGAPVFLVWLVRKYRAAGLVAAPARARLFETELAER
jgi:phosphatidylglycerophosphate synthase